MASFVRLWLAIAILGIILGSGVNRGFAQPQAQPSVTINGIAGELKSNVESFLTLPDEECTATPARLRRQLARDEKQSRSALNALGYYQPEITSELDITGECWRATLNISPGAPVTVRSVNIALSGAGAEDIEFQKLVTAPVLNKGDTARHDRYEELKQSLADLAAERGYLDAQFVRSELRVLADEQLADIIIEYATGKRYHIATVEIDQDVLNPEFVKRLQPFEDGATYSSSHIVKLQQNLNNSGYFSNVRVIPRLDKKQGDSVPLDVQLTPRKRFSYSAGVGAATDIGPRLRFGLRNNRVNRRGHQFGARTAVSAVQSEIALDYTFPGDDPLSEWIKLDAGYKVEDTDTTDSETALFGLRRGKKRPFGWQETRSLEFSRENFVVSGDRRSTTLLVPGLSWIKTRAQRRHYPRAGYRLNLIAVGSLEELISEVSFGQIEARAKGIAPMPFNARLIARTDVGLTKVDEFAELPSSYRFFAGGDSSVRGYDFKTLGPVDSAGEATGGRQLAVASVEYEQPVYNNWSLALFVDHGGAVNSLDFNALETGAGAGLRWHSPIGPIRLDFANAISGNNNWRLHLTMGPDL